MSAAALPGRPGGAVHRAGPGHSGRRAPVAATVRAIRATIEARIAGLQPRVPA
ncbi:hypothetical protein J7F01_19595 [Streptomyces sp. ISL-22]|uniref:hypothetical protein n=1 Tax=unclassified Streptomyces TaxID=2593676 RepID=UPI001BE709AE|nr:MULTISPECIES: hypothetical protein [unclassified Streptomyces]MBT2418558.1 hypothetical protein [Streptomyces sp. ISL-24]MBT2434339.1 hypothetical protein [Streptomyces sp. ISL-22]